MAPASSCLQLRAPSRSRPSLCSRSRPTCPTPRLVRANVAGPIDVKLLSSMVGVTSEMFSKPLAVINRAGRVWRVTLGKVWRVLVAALYATAFRIWSSLFNNMPLFSRVTVVFAQKAIEAALRSKEDVAASYRAVADLSPYLLPVAVEEVIHIRKMSALTALSYKPWLVTPLSLKRRMNMELVNSSWAIKTEAEKARAKDKVMEEPRSALSVMSNLLSSRSSSAFSSASASTSSTDTYLDFTFLEWFSTDERSTNTRFFVVMGSDTMDHWRLNLTVDPVTFEDPALGVKIHSGVYEAAEALYGRFMPSVLEFMESNPSGKICFVGHSIGGSMAMTLMLMFKMRGILKEENMADVYTFGAPSVFLEGEDCFKRITSAAPKAAHDHHHHHHHGPPCEYHTHCDMCSSGSRGLLEAVGLPESIIRNVMMAYDFVPRAFTSDFACVAKIMSQLGPGLQSHSMLDRSREGRKHLYFYVGKVLVMQVDNKLTFVGTDTAHPMLPSEPAVYYIESPNPAVKYRPPHLPMPDSQSVPVLGSSFVPASSAEAVSELMDNPHPMDMFSQPLYTYGAKGGISRYHNPEHYTRAFARVVHYMTQQAARPRIAVPLVSV